MVSDQDIYFMRIALAEAEKAYALEEVPVGAVVVYGQEVIARAHNKVQAAREATAHAELLALQRACQAKGEKYLPECTLYVTLEPCAMCAGACFWTQIGKVVFGASDEKRGYRRWQPDLLHPKTVVLDDLLAQESCDLLQRFFRKLRLP
ncbi:MAG: nucleoside deaminase [Bacteroidota bacterium]